MADLHFFVNESFKIQFRVLVLLCSVHLRIDSLSICASSSLTLSDNLVAVWHICLHFLTLFSHTAKHKKKKKSITSIHCNIYSILSSFAFSSCFPLSHGCESDVCLEGQIIAFWGEELQRMHEGKKDGQHTQTEREREKSDGRRNSDICFYIFHCGPHICFVLFWLR